MALEQPASGSKALIIAIIVAAVVLGGVGIGIIATMRNQNARTASGAGPAADPPAAAKPAEPAARGADPAPAPPKTAPEPKSTASPAPPIRGRGRSSPQSAAVSDPSPAPPPAAPAPATATLQLQYDGAPYPLSLVADGRTVGRVTEGQTSVTVEAGRLRLRAVNEQLFLDHDLGTVTVGAGERRTLTIPATAVVVIGVRGENYTGLRILLDGRPLAGPYPAQLPRIAAVSHKIEFRWSDGALQGVTIADAIDLSGGRQFIIRAVPEGATVNLQKVR